MSTLNWVLLVIALPFVALAVTLACIIFRPSLPTLPSLRLSWSGKVWRWIGGIATVVALATLAFIGFWVICAIAAAIIVLLFILAKAGSGFRTLFGGLVTTGLIVLGLMWIYTNHMRRAETPPLSASDPTAYTYTLTEMDGDKEVGRATLVRVTESNSAVIAFEFTENAGGICRFVQKLGPGGDIGHWNGPQNGKGTFRVTEFLPGKVSVVRGNMWYEKSGYGMPVNHMHFFTLAPTGR